MRELSRTFGIVWRSVASFQMSSGHETEIKLRVKDADWGRQQLEKAGFAVTRPRLFETNTLYDTPDQALRRRGMILRLRQAGERFFMTWKGRPEAGPHKSRPELETSIGSLETINGILAQVGFTRVFRYEKYRTEFCAADSPGIVTLDETPVGDFFELEGSGDWIDRTAARLGFAHTDYILESYGRLYLSECERRGVEPGDMVFASHPL